jgi:hypothetical protein
VPLSGDASASSPRKPGGKVFANQECWGEPDALAFEHCHPQQIAIVGSKPTGDMHSLLRAIGRGKPPFAMTFPKDVSQS